MPHIAVSMYPGRDAEVKKKLALKLQETVAEELNIRKEVITVTVEDVAPEKWPEHMGSFAEETFFVAPQGK